MSYNELYEAYKRRYVSDFSGKKIQDDVNKIWKKMKGDIKNFPGNVNEKIKELKASATAKRAGLLTFYTKASQTKQPAKEGCVATSQVATTSSNFPPPVSASDKDEKAENRLLGKSKKRKPASSISSSGSSSTSSDEDDTDTNVPTPAQDKLRSEIALLESELNSAFIARDSGLSDDSVYARISKLRKELESKKKLLKRKKAKAQFEKKYRAERKLALKEILDKDPSLATTLKIREQPGKPRLETDQPELLKAIVELAIVGGAADDRRRCDKIRTCKTLDELHEELSKQGFNLSRSATYLRLLPHDARNSEGKRHVKTVPVKLCKPDNSQHKTHPDGKFCTATIRSLETLASILGNNQVAIVSQDDKARVPIGITAANKQAPFLMSMEYKVTLPDHDWVVAARHKLIPSVYAGILIKTDKINGDPAAVTYSGPTFVAIRSGKHSSSNAGSHAFDLDTLYDLPEFEEVLKDNGDAKPVLLISVDGGPDENPRYPNVINHAAHHFRQRNLDAIFIFTNAPGRSAYNRVERRMAPLSRELAGVILPHDHFGSHLDGQCRAVDQDLEVKNFQYAGEILADIWSDMKIDGFPVTAQYCEAGCEKTVEAPSLEWYAKHVRESQYFLQIVKCDESQCCGLLRSDLKQVLPEGFFPAPFPMRRTSTGLVIPEPAEVCDDDEYPPFLLRNAQCLKPKADAYPDPPPFDLYCPSINDQLPGRVCIECGLYFASKSNAARHKKEIHGKRITKKTRPLNILRTTAEEVLCVVDVSGQHEVMWMGKDTVEEVDPIVENNDNEIIPLINSIPLWILSPWTEDL